MKYFAILLILSSCHEVKVFYLENSSNGLVYNKRLASTDTVFVVEVSRNYEKGDESWVPDKWDGHFDIYFQFVTPCFSEITERKYLNAEGRYINSFLIRDSCDISHFRYRILSEKRYSPKIYLESDYRYINIYEKESGGIIVIMSKNLMVSMHDYVDSLRTVK